MLWYCRVLRIEGDYAVLVRTDDPAAESFLQALALLPEGVDAGMLLRCENFVYTICC